MNTGFVWRENKQLKVLILLTVNLKSTSSALILIRFRFCFITNIEFI